MSLIFPNSLDAEYTHIPGLALNISIRAWTDTLHIIFYCLISYYSFYTGQYNILNGPPASYAWHV